MIRSSRACGGPTHRLAGVAADGAGVGLRALRAYRKAALVARAATRADVLQALDILRHFAAKLSLDGEALGERADCLLLVGSQSLPFLVGRNPPVYRISRARVGPMP